MVKAGVEKLEKTKLEGSEIMKMFLECNILIKVSDSSGGSASDYNAYCLW